MQISKKLFLGYLSGYRQVTFLLIHIFLIRISILDDILLCLLTHVCGNLFQIELSMKSLSSIVESRVFLMHRLIQTFVANTTRFSNQREPRAVYRIIHMAQPF